MAWLAHFGPRDRYKGNIYHIVQNPLTNANVFFSVILFFFWTQNADCWTVLQQEMINSIIEKRASQSLS